MKKIAFLLIIATILLAGCKKNDQMPDYIPAVLSEDTEDTQDAKAEEAAPGETTPAGTDDAAETTPTPKTVYVGQTTTKYVKLTEYDDTLNVRSAPSTSADKVGFLVHTEKIEVIEIKDGWASFLYKDAICYVNADYLVDEKPDYIDPPTPTAVPEKPVIPAQNEEGPDI